MIGSDDELLLVLINDVKKEARGGLGGAAVMNTVDCMGGEGGGGGGEYGSGGGITDIAAGARWSKSASRVLTVAFRVATSSSCIFLSFISSSPCSFLMAIISDSRAAILSCCSSCFLVSGLDVPPHQDDTGRDSSVGMTKIFVFEFENDVLWDMVDDKG